MPDSPAMRASDADRERAATLLRDSAADGRLTVEELTDRLELAWSAKTLDQLTELTADVDRGDTPQPLAATAPAGPATPRLKATSWLVAVMGGTSRKGRWRADRQVRAIAVMGGCDIDLRNAELEGGEVTITAIAVMGGIDICVPEGVAVEVGGFVLMGGKDTKVDGVPRPGAPLVRVRAFGLMGGVSVHTPKRRRSREPDEERARRHTLGH
ncbi:DUF1707 domain-containing protein [Conexibacter stalactiti]|uniref:DUF1707 domain-containing protein n=1 Tax=Conexibacter stalactiti TaxID=1940611 RepID=A0ABU4HWV9_9ACTN|nr:DUF1707 domain-containing protein [Conexibacter stalactiti]MDW5597811.1 DUF1707 domain-containing protein [Conexibacter stalactiti]MEC5038453.1 DUF1707 domain-containing protein [Conexibacter stalactiti]